MRTRNRAGACRSAATAPASRYILASTRKLGRPRLRPPSIRCLRADKLKAERRHSVKYRLVPACSACTLKPQCTIGPVRKVTRDIDEEVRDRVRALADTEAFQQSRRERKKVEMLFAHMKRILKLDRLRLRGLSGAAT